MPSVGHNLPAGPRLESASSLRELRECLKETSNEPREHVRRWREILDELGLEVCGARFSARMSVGGADTAKSCRRMTSLWRDCEGRSDQHQLISPAVGVRSSSRILASITR